MSGLFDTDPSADHGADTVGGVSSLDGIHSHQHLWHLADGTPLFAPIGLLVEDPQTGDLCCHTCGRWFAALGAHVRIHGQSAAEYRLIFGLARTRPLTSLRLSEQRSKRQRSTYRDSPEARKQLAPGRALASSGALTTAARAANQELGLDAQRRRLDALRAGRETQQQRRLDEEQRVRAALAVEETSVEAHLAALAATMGADDVARATGLSRSRARAALREQAPRLPGQNTELGRRARAIAADRMAADRVGASDIGAWLRAERAQGATMEQLADAVGRSLPWVRSRIRSS